jgi:hypothetical protein
MQVKNIKKRISKIWGWAECCMLPLFIITGLLLINACNGGSGSSGDTPPAVINNGDPIQGDEEDETGDEGDSATPVYTWNPSAFTHVYDVGPGKQYAEPGDVPWENLEPSTLVRIYYRTTPYQAKWVINVAATALSPVVVLGIPEGDQRPIISGDDAITRTELDYWNEVRSIIKIGGSSIPDNPDVPSHIYIQGLDIRSARPGYQFTDDAGNTQEYSTNAAAIHIEEGSDITVHDCLIHDAANGLFSGSASSRVRISGNYVYGNGIEDSIYQHNSYTESLGIVFEYNHYGPLRAGCLGNNLKDRSSGTIIRYNWIEAGNRQLDLVETDYDHIANDPAYDETFVYGNVLIEPDGAGNSQIMHYGGDGGDTDMYRRGTLYFYHNTVVSTRSGNTTLMRLSTLDVTALVFNNIIYASAGGGYLAITSGNGQTELEDNWLPEDWQLTHESDLDPGATVADLGNIEGITPGFLDFSAQDFHLSSGSLARGNAGSLPTDVANYPVEYQYVQHQQIEIRSLESLVDIGAFGY